MLLWKRFKIRENNKDKVRQMRRFLAATACILTLLTGASQRAYASAEGFPAWLQTFRAEAQQAGISPATIQSALTEVKYLPRVIELDRKQPESRLTFAQYREKIVSAQRINEGRAMLKKHAAILDRISKQYGVQPQYIVALWGIETSYGKITGDFSIIDSLATLAYEGRRGPFFKDELIKALRILDQDHITKDRMKGSWAGAMGQSQFMPSSFLSFAQDFNGDGRRDIWTTQEDVFASIANYLSSSGWKGDERWGRLIAMPPSGIPEALMGREVKKTLAEWNALGVRLPGGAMLPHVEGLRASLVAPDSGPGNPVYMTYGNYDVIMKWNRSTYFATSVGMLADAIAAGQ